MKLYHHPISPYSQKALLGFYEKGIEFEGEIVSLVDPDARERYEREVHPLGKVPMLVLEDGHRIPESTIILEYIDTHVDQGPRLIPDDREHARKARYHDRMCDLYVLDPVVLIFFDARRKEADKEPKRVAHARVTLERAMALFEGALRRGPWILGDDVSIADCAMAPALGYLRTFEDLQRWPHVAAYWSRVEAWPAWKQVMKDAEPYATVLAMKP